MKRVPVLVALSYLVMVAVNALANILPIGGMNTGAVSDSYPNLFAPAGITFSIWAFIYLLLALHTIYQFTNKRKETLDTVGLLFALSSVANSLWIFSWHYHKIGLSVVLMLCILALLIRINLIIQTMKGDRMFVWAVRIPFSVYLGWITVATIANITTLLVSAQFTGFSIPEPVWTVAVLVVGVAIGLAWAFRTKDKAYLITLIWAYTGILIKHTSQEGFASQYMMVIVATCLALAVFVGCLGFFFKQQKNMKKN